LKDGFGEERGEGRCESMPEEFWKAFVTVVVVDEVEVLRD
jgi:hypothetical protein